MSDIKSFKFNKEDFNKIRKYHFGYNWPVVYIIEDKKEIYIGETTNAYNRSRQHIENPERAKLKDIHIITDEEYNKSAALDIESMLIQHIVADGKYVVQNGNKGLSNHNYFDRPKYQSKFEKLWDQLREMSLTQNNLIQIRNSQIFKYSPYKTLTTDQINIVKDIKKVIKNNEKGTMIVDGGPGTGKTIMATYMIKNLIEHNDFKHLKIGFVVPMTPLRKTIKSVFKQVKGLSAGMVIGPSEVINEIYDILVVDEAHRLKQRKNLTNYPSHDNVTEKLNLDKDATQLDWIMNSSKFQIFFYDENQSVVPADVDFGAFAKLDTIYRNKLDQQIRVKGGERYIDFISNVLQLEPSECNFEDYDFMIFDRVDDMINEIKTKDKEYGLCRNVAGYAWDWKTNKGLGDYDIDIDGLKLVWNSTSSDWVNSENSINEIGCIHTIQGYDLNYTGVIIGPELAYDPEKHELIVDKDKYKDSNGKRSLSKPEELKTYILNIYKTLLTRGIYGTYIYVADENLREFLKAAVEDKVMS
jgi:DUF2075 family protein/DNA replication protein DnaC